MGSDSEDETLEDPVEDDPDEDGDGEQDLDDGGSQGAPDEATEDGDDVRTACIFNFRYFDLSTGITLGGFRRWLRG
jgi:hypothetical protein